MRFWLEAAFEKYGMIPYHASEDAPSTAKELFAWANENTLGVDSMPVYSGGCEGNIYGAPEANYAFRAWHDSIHIKEEFDFSLDGEVKSSNKHLEVLSGLNAPTEVIKAFQADVEGQARYYHASGKQFVDNQIRFVEECMWYGIPTVIDWVSSGKRY